MGMSSLSPVEVEFEVVEVDDVGGHVIEEAPIVGNHH